MKIAFLCLKAYILSRKSKLIKETFVKQTEDDISYEIYSALRLLKFREEER